MSSSTKPKPKRRAAADEELILEGDCLELLSVAARLAGRPFDLVYMDPPFNAGGTRAARRTTGLRASGDPAYADHWGGLEGFLAMLEPRIAATRDTMSDRSSLWLHLDHRAVHDAKVLVDRVFGRRAFKGEIVWVPGNGARGRRAPSVTHQTILVYSRGRDMIWNPDDEALREPFAETSLRMHFRHEDAGGRRYRERLIGGKKYRYYADVGRRIGSVWHDCPAMHANTPIRRETTGYPTQKPESLLHRIVRAASLPSSPVLDPMCGSGTTVAVARKLGRTAVGIDSSPVACRIARERLRERARPSDLGAAPR